MMIAAALVLFILLCLALGLDHSCSNETRPARNELVFADRNREYGAYRLRTEYGSHVGLALLGAIGVFGAAVVIPAVIAHFRQPVIADGRVPVVVDIDLARVFTLPPEPPPTAAFKSATAAPKAKQDPNVQHPVQAVDNEELPPMADVDTASTTTTIDTGNGRSGITDPGGLPPGATGTGPATGISVWNRYDVQVVPEFPSGERAMGEWVRRNLDLPADLVGKDMVYVQFTIGLDGSVEDVKAVKGKLVEYKKAAERTIRRMPRWKPAQMNGHDVRCRLILPLKFETR